MKWVFDSEEAQWLTTGLRDFWDRRLVSVAPRGFAAYGRLFHPAYDQEGHPLKWADVARIHGTVFTSRSDFVHVTSVNGAGRWVGEAPMPGSMDESTIRPLIRILRYFSETPDQIYYALWDGLGWDNARILSMAQSGARATDPIPKSVREGPRISIPGRSYLMYAGTLDDAMFWMPHYRQTPHYWWPQDHAWCVAGDVDLSWTIIGGSRDLIEHLINAEDLEVLLISQDDVLESDPPGVK